MADQQARIVISAQDKTGSAFAAVEKGLSGITTKAGALQAATAGIPAIGPLIAAAFSGAAFKGVVDSLDTFDDLAEKTGISAERLSELRFASEVAGTSFEDLQAGTRKLVQQMAAAAGGSKEAQATFDALGVSVVDSTGKLRGTDEVLQDLADRFASYSDGPAKAALATDLFGRSGAQLIPVLNKGSQGLADLSAEAQRLGATIDNDAAAAAGRFNDNLAKLSLLGRGAAASLVGDMLPALNRVLESITAGREAFGGLLAYLGSDLTFKGEYKIPLDGVQAYKAEFESLQQRIAEARQRIETEPFDPFGQKGLEELEQRQVKVQQLITYYSKLAGLSSGAAGGGRGFVSQAQVDAPVPTKPDEAAAKAGQQALAAYDALIAKIRGRVDESNREVAAAGKVAEADKFAAQIVQELAAGKSKLNDAQKAAVRAALDAATAQLRENEALQAARQAREDMARTQAKLTDEALRESESIAAQTESLRLQAEEAGLTATALQQLALARTEAAQAAADQALIDAVAAGADPQRIEALTLTSEELRSQVQLRRQLVQQEQARDAAAMAMQALDEAEAIGLQTQALRDSIAEIGLTTRQLEALQIARLQATAATKQQAVADAIAAGASAETVEALQVEVDALNEYIEARRELGRETDAFGADTARGLQRGLDAYRESLGTASDQAAEFVQNTAGSLEDGLLGLYRGQEGAAKQLVDSILNEFLRLAVIKPLLNGIFGGKDGSTGLVGSLAGLFGGARAMGGPVDADKTYLVGERGPELFTPRAAGQITPNNAIGGTTVNMQVSVGEFVTPSQLAQVAQTVQQAAIAGSIEGKRRGRF